MSRLFRIRHGCTGRYFAYHPHAKSPAWIDDGEEVFKSSNIVGFVSRGDELTILSLISHLSGWHLTKGFVVEEYDGEKWNDFCNHTDYEEKISY